MVPTAKSQVQKKEEGLKPGEGEVLEGGIVSKDSMRNTIQLEG